MSRTTIALEAAVAAAIVATVPEGVRPTPRQRANIDKAFTIILKLIAPRIRHFIRQYGLIAHWEDAEQCCAIAVHRAIQGYDPEKAQFTTFVNWQIRGELQGLRFRVMTDQRPSARKVAATTVSLHAATRSVDGEERTLESTIEDEYALARTESAASDYLANAATASLVAEFIAESRCASLKQLRRRPRAKPPVAAAVSFDMQMLPRRRSPTHGIDAGDVENLEQKLERDRQIVERRVFDCATLDELGLDTGVTKERVRQITNRATKSIAALALTSPRFAVMADYRRPSGQLSRLARTRAAALLAQSTALLPVASDPHNSLSRIIPIVAPRSDPAFDTAARDNCLDLSDFTDTLGRSVSGKIVHH
jgi:RNA polymerase sigma-32 factor